MLIREVDFTAALKLLVSAEKKMHKTFGGLGTAIHSDITEKILSYIQVMKIATRSVILARFYRDLDPDTLRGIEETGQQMHVISVQVLPDKKDKLYKWIKDETQH